MQNKRSRISYKNRKLRNNPQEQWNIVENTHEPIIEKQLFDKVQKMVIVQNYNRNEKKHKFLLDGLLFCYECKQKLGLCTSHGFSYETLEKDVLQYIRKLFLAIDRKKDRTKHKKQSNSI